MPAKQKALAYKESSAQAQQDQEEDNLLKAAPEDLTFKKKDHLDPPPLDSEEEGLDEADKDVVMSDETDVTTSEDTDGAQDIAAPLIEAMKKKEEKLGRNK